jgi:hypothetical protein
MRRLAGVLVSLSCLVAVLPAAQAERVQVTVPRANVRSEASEKSPILVQVTPADQIELRAVEGDWFKVLLPPNPALGGARVEAYISKKVSKVVAAPLMPETPETPAPVGSAPNPSIDPHAATVTLGSGTGASPLSLLAVRLVPNGNRTAWTVSTEGGLRSMAGRRPTLTVSIGDRAGFAAADVIPSMVKVSPAPGSTVDVVLGSTRDGLDWRADEVSTGMTEAAPGVWNLSPVADLAPGRYAIVMRPSNAATAMPEVAWLFAVR